jgi:hypothetical protein
MSDWRTCGKCTRWANLNISRDLGVCRATIPHAITSAADYCRISPGVAGGFDPRPPPEGTRGGQ